MKTRVILALSISVSVCGLGGCKDWKLPRISTAESTSGKPVEHIDAAERAAAAKDELQKVGRSRRDRMELACF